jgi:septal ring factor EnvC (AmiA/AmiB activator)
MSAGNNFVDLRMANAGIAGDTEDSVWPAFTDIMTVVLMIFLMSLVAFLIRNTQLVDELQTALIEKDQITQTAFLSAEQNSALQAQLALVRERILSLESSLQTVTGAKDQLQQTLEQREQSVRDLETEIALLTRLRDQLSNSNSDLFKQLDLSRLALTESEQTLAESEQTLGETSQSLARTELALAETEAEYSESKNTLNEKISLLLAAKAGLIIAKEKGNQALTDSEAAKLELNRRIIALSEQLRLISDKLDSQTSKNELLDSQLEDQRTIMAGLSSTREELEQKLLEMSKNLGRLQRLYELRGSVVTDLRAELTGGELKFKSLQEEYDSLGEQYRKLIRPARSPAGKYVVDVYFAKQAGKAVYRMREPGQAEPIMVSLDELETRLGALKEEYQQRLYTKVRIDDKSGIGFSEAWVFTQKMLSQYDYYSNDFSEISPESDN